MTKTLAIVKASKASASKASKASKPKRPLPSFVFYRGPSMLDGAPIIAIATIKRSKNTKTGAMVQTWILREDINPIDAARTGADFSICGNCVHRGRFKIGLISGTAIRIESTRSCYVRLDTAPRNVWGTYHRGRYTDLANNLPEAAARIAGRIVRLGSYGDPAAVPYGVWSVLLSQAAGHTGYTHQWRQFPELAIWVMASCDSSVERVHARALGFRTFRVAPAASWVKESGEVLCPASAEAGKKTSCIACKACGGTSAKARADIVIPAHGGGKNLVRDKAAVAELRAADAARLAAEAAATDAANAIVDSILANREAA